MHGVPLGTPLPLKVARTMTRTPAMAVCVGDRSVSLPLLFKDGSQIDREGDLWVLTKGRYRRTTHRTLELALEARLGGGRRFGRGATRDRSGVIPADHPYEATTLGE